ncbi:hypothetical protein GCM10017781_12710 [Deinococcus metalli]|uniref:Uncharacterized protein n=1 Tax=Deinococcus metalli TaxID=1141878 RepID=A0ABQ3JNH0_9DEIO|nr:hypothetical protein GCM10017781_12710 [Deinococcus metalli]
MVGLGASADHASGEVCAGETTGGGTGLSGVAGVVGVLAGGAAHDISRALSRTARTRATAGAERGVDMRANLRHRAGAGGHGFHDRNRLDRA